MRKYIAVLGLAFLVSCGGGGPRSQNATPPPRGAFLGSRVLAPFLGFPNLTANRTIALPGGKTAFLGYAYDGNGWAYFLALLDAQGHRTVFAPLSGTYLLSRSALDYYGDAVLIREDSADGITFADMAEDGGRLYLLLTERIRENLQTNPPSSWIREQSIVIALDAQTGKVVPGWGQNGVAALPAIGSVAAGFGFYRYDTIDGRKIAVDGFGRIYVAGNWKRQSYNTGATYQDIAVTRLLSGGQIDQAGFTKNSLGIPGLALHSVGQDVSIQGLAVGQAGAYRIAGSVAAYAAGLLLAGLQDGALDPNFPDPADLGTRNLASGEMLVKSPMAGVVNLWFRGDPSVAFSFQPAAMIVDPATQDCLIAGHQDFGTSGPSFLALARFAASGKLIAANTHGEPSWNYVVVTEIAMSSLGLPVVGFTAFDANAYRAAVMMFLPGLLPDVLFASNGIREFPSDSFGAGIVNLPQGNLGAFRHVVYNSGDLGVVVDELIP